MEDRLLLELFVILVVAFLVCWGASRAKLSATLGLLLAGVAVGMLGPHGGGFLHEVHFVSHLAEIGVGFLLLPVGMEFSLDRLKGLWKQLTFGGTLQMGLTAVLGGYAYQRLFQASLPSAAFVGLLMAMSSTVIVIDRLEERKKLQSPGGLLAMGVLIFQDLTLLPLALITPMLAPGASSLGQALQKLLLGLVILAVTFLLESLFVNKVLEQVAKTRDRALLITAVAIVCLGATIGTAKAGLSPAFGMFLAGIMLSRSECRFEVLGIGIILKRLFGPLHFISFGLLLEFPLFLEHPVKIIGSALGLIVLKLFTGFLTAVLLGYNARSACKFSGALAHIGELSFVLAAAGVSRGVISELDFGVFVIISVLSILASPFVMDWTVKLAEYLPFWSAHRFVEHNGKPLDPQETQGHVVVFGYGHVGRLTAHELRAAGVEVVVVENVQTRSTKAKAEGFRVFNGDATNLSLLQHLAIGSARAVVFAFSDAESRGVAINHIRSIAPDIPLVARVERFEDERELGIQRAGVILVVNEASAAVALASQALESCGIPQLTPAQVDELSNILLNQSA